MSATATRDRLLKAAVEDMLAPPPVTREAYLAQIERAEIARSTHQCLANSGIYGPAYDHWEDEAMNAAGRVAEMLAELTGVAAERTRAVLS